MQRTKCRNIVTRSSPGTRAGATCLLASTPSGLESGKSHSFPCTIFVGITVAQALLVLTTSVCASVCSRLGGLVFHAIFSVSARARGVFFLVYTCSFESTQQQQQRRHGYHHPQRPQRPQKRQYNGNELACWTVELFLELLAVPEECCRNSRR